MLNRPARFVKDLAFRNGAIYFNQTNLNLSLERPSATGDIATRRRIRADHAHYSPAHRRTRYVLLINLEIGTLHRCYAHEHPRG